MENMIRENPLADIFILLINWSEIQITKYYEPKCKLHRMLTRSQAVGAINNWQHVRYCLAVYFKPSVEPMHSRRVIIND